MIGFAGLSHLGIVSSIAGASKGFEVVGFDRDAALCAQLAAGELPVLEPDLPELLATSRERIRFSADPAALSGCDVVYFSVDVPTDRENRSDPGVVRSLVEEVAAHAKPGAALVVLSQVPPGFTRQLARDVARSLPGRRLRVIGQVETLVFGRAVERALHPERYILGLADPTEPLPEAFAGYLAAWACPVLPMRYESAELAKISINMCLAASVTVANTLAELCEETGADWNEIAPSLRLDRRIGQHAYLAPGLGLSGGNLERDLVTIQRLSREHGTDAGVVDAWLRNSAYRRDWLLRTLHAEVLSQVENPVVALWGLAYKQDTHSTKNSPAIALLESLGATPVRAHDPQVVLASGQFPHVRQIDDPLDACRGADALVIATPWRHYHETDPQAVRSRLRGKVLIDPFGVLDGAKAGMIHFRLGYPKDPPAPGAVEE